MIVKNVDRGIVKGYSLFEEVLPSIRGMQSTSSSQLTRLVTYDFLASISNVGNLIDWRKRFYNSILVLIIILTILIIK